MTDTAVRHFSYRHPRFPARLRMDFVVGVTVILGICESISESGLSGMIGDELPCGVEGQTTLYHQEQTYSVRASLTSREKDSIHLTFLFTTEEERASLRSFIEAVRLRPS